MQRRVSGSSSDQNSNASASRVVHDDVPTQAVLLVVRTERAIGKVDLNVEARQNSSIPHTAGRDDFALDGLGPGYRQIQLRADGRSDTHVMQLEP